jgi:phosphoserine phosphatase RsbU/P
MPHFRSVRARLLCWVLLVTIPIFSTSLYLSNRASVQRLARDAERQADRLAAALAADLDGVIRPIEGGTRTVAQVLEDVDLQAVDMRKLIQSIVLASPEVYGSTIALEDPRLATGQADFAPYYYRREGRLLYADLSSASYAYREQPWYRLAADGGRPVWSAPYFDDGGGNIWMITYSVPFFREAADGKRRVAGVVTADLALDWVRVAARSVALDSAFGWLSANAHDSFVVPVGPNATLWQAHKGTLDEARLRTIGRSMLEQGRTFDQLPAQAGEQAAYLAARELQTLDWRLTLWLPREQLFAEARRLLLAQFWLGGIGLALLIAAIIVVSSRISRPITALADSVRQAGEGNLEFQLPDKPTRDEIGTLTSALARLRDSLKEHVQALASTLADRRRLEHELEIAAQIQQSMLPRGAPLAAPDQDIRIAAALVPAREVGGDLYDYFEVQDRQMLFAIGDVSDKGVPAAIFMARLSGLLRAVGVSGQAPHRILSLLNSRLAESNEACMFVTAGCGMLDLRDGCLRYASAGHDAPILRSAAGAVTILESEIGAAIGIDEQVEYQGRETYLAPGDTLVLFTDGVTEAEDRDNMQFGAERLMELVRNAPSGDVMTLIKIIVDGVATHVADHPASDDLTILLISYRPRDVRIDNSHGSRWILDIPAQREAIPLAQLRLQGILRARSVDATRIDDAALVVEELVANVIASAEQSAHVPHIALEIEISPEEVLLNLSDDCPAFDPLQLAEPQLDAEIAERPIGGLGVFLVRQLADTCRYERVNGRNNFEVRLRRSQSPLPIAYSRIGS